MSSIISNARHLMAVMSPQTGTRSTGTVTVTATGSDVTVPMGSYAVPIVDGCRRADLVFKVDEGPNADKSWTVTNGGDDVDFLSNIGGARHNLADTTVLNFDPPISGIDSLEANGAFTGGAETTALGGIKDMVLYEQIAGTDPSLDLSRSSIKAFPGAVITWQMSRSVGSPMIRGVASSQEFYTITILTSRMESDHLRRQEGQIALDALTNLLIDRKEVDGVRFSNPNGIQIERRGRESITRNVHQQFYVYYLSVIVTSTFNQTDSRVYHDLETLNMDVLKPQDPALPNQGDYTLIDDSETDMT